MYNTDEELDIELNDLKEKIRLEASEASNPADDDMDVKLETAENSFENSIRALFEAEKTDEEIISAISEALDTAGKRFKAECDIDDLILQEEKIKEVYPEFDIAIELKKNPIFKRLIANGVDVHKALLASNNGYEDVITNFIKRDARREMADLLIKNKAKVVNESGRMSREAQVDVSQMSDDEFSVIEEQVKKNKRVFL